MKTLYIIGNGFDMHHDIKCSYKNFREWLGEHHSDVPNKIEEIYGGCDSEWWSDFEYNLGEIELMDYAQRIAIENPVELSSDHCDNTWNDAQVTIENEMSELYKSLRKNFEKWIAQLNPPSPDKQIYIDKNDAKFIVFNYTQTLETLYKVPIQKILHIHGMVGKNEELIFGHGKSKEVLKKEHPTPNDLYYQGKLDEESASNYDIHDVWAWEEMFDQVSSMRKPVEKIIEQNKNFFNSIKGVRKICVYGFSFSDIDEPYLSKINNYAPDAHWEISCFSPRDRTRAKNFCYKFGIKDFSIIRLSELQNLMQLEIEFISQ